MRVTAEMSLYPLQGQPLPKILAFIAEIASDARLEVVVDAADATVSIDDEVQGPPGKMTVKPGKHRVEVRAPGRALAVQDVRLIGDRDATLAFTLKPEEVPPTVPVAGHLVLRTL